MKKRYLVLIGIIASCMMAVGCAGVPGAKQDAAYEVKEVTDTAEKSQHEESSAIDFDEHSSAENEDTSGDTKEKVLYVGKKFEEVNQSEEVEHVILSDKEIEESVNDIVKEFDALKYNLLLEGMYNMLDTVGAKTQIMLTQKEMTRIAGMCDSVKRGPEVEMDSGWCVAQTLDTDDLEETCMNLFGVPADVSLLDTYSDGDDGTLWYNNEVSYVTYCGETDTEIVPINMYSEVSGDEISATEDLFVGHWSYQSDKSNFRITYKFDRNDDSKYGIVLSQMILERTDDETSFGRIEEVDTVAFDRDGFYGIWVGASKNEDEANALKDKVSAAGLAGVEVVLTTDWENLNSKPFYVVTAGTYPSKKGADTCLDIVKAAGYSDAYVKFTGRYIGD